MGHEQVREHRPLGVRGFLHQITLDLPLFLLCGQTKPLAQTNTVRVDWDPFDDAIRRREDNRCRLPSDTPKSEHLAHRTRNLPSEIRKNRTARLLDRLRLHFECTAGMNVLFQF